MPKQPQGAMQLAYAVAKGEIPMATLKPSAKSAVERIVSAYGGLEAVKDLATYKAPHVKIGQRATLYRKVR